ncbi:MAG: IS3 family transposase [Aggregatilineales bacterium]
MSRYRFIRQETDNYPIRRLCAVLEVSHSGYYAWLKRGPSQRAQANERLSQEIERVHRDSRSSYGYLRVHAELRAQGWRVGKHRVARLMRQKGLKARYKRPFRVTTRRDERHSPTPNLLKGDFSASSLNDKWLADITYIPTREGWLYVAGLLDACSRHIVGWSMSERMTTQLVIDAWQMAVGQRGLPRLHHSDRGSQYTSSEFRSFLEQAGVQVSMSDVGRCYDNAMKESFWSALKRECADHVFVTREAARRAIFEYIELWYNRRRRHSALGYLSPAEYERQLARL